MFVHPLLELVHVRVKLNSGSLDAVATSHPDECPAPRAQRITVDGGQRAVIFDKFRGILPDVKGEGTHFRIPFIQVWRGLFLRPPCSRSFSRFALGSAPRVRVCMCVVCSFSVSIYTILTRLDATLYLAAINILVFSGPQDF